MTTRQARKILIEHNQWRRGAHIDMHKPKDIGIAIDKVIRRLDLLEAERKDPAKLVKKATFTHVQ